MWEKKDDADPNDLLQNKKSYHILQVNFTFSDVLIAQCSLRNRGDPSKGPA